MNTDVQPIKVYGAPWCPDCRRSKRFLEAHRFPYEWINIDEDRYPELCGSGRPTTDFPMNGSTSTKTRALCAMSKKSKAGNG